MKLSLPTMLLVAATLPPSTRADSITVPHGQTILMDGKCEPTEWRAARSIELPNHYILLIQETHDFLELCVRPPKPAMFMTELYPDPTVREP